MKLVNWKSIFAIAALTLTAGFQNCSAVKFGGAETASEAQKGRNMASSGGDVYGGKLYIHYLANGICADGTKIASIIKGSLQAGFLMTRDSCLNLNLERPLAAALIDISNDSLVYDNHLYVSETPSVEAPLPEQQSGAQPLPVPIQSTTYECTGDDRSGWTSNDGKFGDLARLNLTITIAAASDGVLRTQVLGSIAYSNASNFINKSPFVPEAQLEDMGGNRIFVRAGSGSTSQIGMKVELQTNVRSFITSVSTYSGGFSNILFSQVVCRNMVLIQ